VTGPASAGFQFALKPATSIYYAQATPDAAPDPRVAFLPPDGAPLPPLLTLPDSWAVDGGVYLFPGAAVASTPAFAAGVRALVTSQQWAGTRLLWVADPNVPVHDWQLAGIPLVGLSAEGGELAALTVFSFRNYGCLLNGGLALTVGVAGPEFGIVQASAGDIRLTTDSGGTELPIAEGPVTIPLTGLAAGCLTFAARLAVGENADGSIDSLDVGCRFFFDDPDLPGTGLITSRRYPVFDTTTAAAGPGAATAIELAAQLDPNAPLDPARTCLAFSSTAPLRSFYRTNLGSPLDLAPADARLQFAVRPAGQQPADADPLYLVPHGKFTVQPPPAEQAPALLCGVGGAEYIALTPATTTTMTFVAGQPAYAPGFDPSQTTAVAAQGPRLAGPVSTSWVSMTAPDGPAYFAQPEGAALFGANAAAAPSTGAPDTGAAGPALLPFFELQAATLPSGDPAAATPYPLVPHAGVSDDLTSYERLEVQVLSQQRRQVIFDLSMAAPPPAPVVPQARATAEAAPAPAATDPCLDPAALTAGTPQGLIAAFSADKSSWACLKLAQSVQEPPGGLPVRQLLALQNVVDPLRSALLTNQQFLVVSDPVAFQQYVGTHNELVIANYRFVLDPAQWGRHGTVMLVKNYRKPLIELIADTNTWVLGTTFNVDVTATQQRLTQIANDAYASGDDDLAAFTALLTDAAWNGILFLNAYVPLDGFPPELAGLAAGIDPALFVAHHVGINQTPLAADLSQQDSSLFGLISYAGSRPLAVSGYDFAVRTLKVRFANSAIASFTSRIDLALGQLFGTAVSLPQGGDVLELDGFYQKHGDTGSYVFSEAMPATFAAGGDPVLSSVRVTKAEFATLVGPGQANTGQAGPGQAGTTVQTVFSFWGTLAFEELSVGSAALGGTVPFDLFSYDSLVFSGMRLEMSFPSAAPSGRSFRFDPSQMTFDAASSTARDHSLAVHFPVTPKGMLVSDANKAPGDYGLLPVDTDLDATPFTTPWYALSYDLNLGSAGALAAQAGLVASLVVVWAPGQSALPVSVGLKLPGATGAKNQLTVEGVLKITMFAVALTYDGTAFLLKLNGIALSLFGQSLPPGGSFDIFVFGDPDPAAGANSLGWYGAYIKDQPTTS